MHGFEWKDQRGIEGTGFVRAIRDLLTSRLPQLVPKLSATISSTLKSEIDDSKCKDGWHRLSLFKSVKHIVTATNCAVFFPPELGKALFQLCCKLMLMNGAAKDEDFMRAALDFPEDVFMASEIIQLLPEFISK